MMRWAAICRLGGIGDNLIAASVLRPLKRLGYAVEVITGEPCHVVYLNNPFIDKLSVKKEGDIPSGGDWQKWFAQRSGEYDLLVNLSHSCEKLHAVWASETSFWWRPEYRRKLFGGSYLETVHDIVGVAHDFGPLFFPTDEERARALKLKKKIGERYVTWVISGSRIDKIYPYAGMAIGRIIKELNIPVVMTGNGGKQFEYAKQIMGHIERQNGSHDGLHLALTPEGADPGGHQDWPIRRSLAQLLASDLVITPDTGAAWACAMEPMPKIVMVSHASAENITKHWVNTTTFHADRNRVPCWPCHRLHNDISTCTPNKDGHASACMSDISVETILERASAFLRRM
jgi:ADP-heptose:LPS heptosyltransferase